MNDHTDIFASLSTKSFIDREFWHNPYPLFDRARQESPVHWSPTFDAWILTRYADILQVLRSSKISSQRSSYKLAGLPPEERARFSDLERSLGSWLVYMDPPRHTRVRNLVGRAFAEPVVESLRARIGAVVDGLLDRAAQRGEMDLVRDLGSPLPTIVISEMLGATDGDRERFERWSSDISAFVGVGIPDLERTRRAHESWTQMTAQVLRTAEDRRKHPRDDFISALVAQDEAGDSLDENDLVQSCVVLLFAGHETTENMLSTMVLSLLANPDAARRLRENPAQIPQAMEELFRYDSPIQKTSRIARAPLEVGGKRIEDGQRMLLLLGAANRDPDQFPEPDRLDLDRPTPRHMSFGFGAHYCAGAYFARVEGQIALERLLTRFPNLRLAGRSAGELPWKTSLDFRGVTSLPLLL
ncbi:cytochrome P450 [Polyangium aurulentum]|uniref:cytochrome P450 n=1 Tax=Polyangium aurulentum TaxID=2567896 RepID=UPI0010AEB70E|nr:cytochrome P450 [Polyangium aurulentum]UQA62879.1 cytochrome P450 [Polyangium aurulentum]